MNLVLGVHVGCSIRYKDMIEIARETGANAFQFFTFHTCGHRLDTKIGEEEMKLFKEAIENSRISAVLAHAPNSLNLCSPYPCKQNAFDLIKGDKALMEIIPGIMYVIPPGNPLGQGKKVGIELLTRALNNHLDESMESTVLLETSSGKKDSIGKTFGEMYSILSRVNHSDKLGICMDISNVYAAGYDIVNNLEGVLEEFDKLIGLDRLKVIQLSDHKGELGDMKEQHAVLGTGGIGYDAVIRIMNHPLLKHLPFYLETPDRKSIHRKEIEILRENYS